MELITWTTAYSVGIKEFDDQHRKLFSLINELFTAMKSGKGKDVIGRTLAGLVDYTRYHFSAEEKYFAQYGYPETAQHLAEHKAFVAQAEELNRKFAAGSMLVSVETLDFVKGWIDKHINKVDKQYTSFFKSKGMS
jgi:hemerythrin